MKLNEFTNNYGSKKKSKRLGRGIGSGKGKTCGRGGKGQTARSGVAIKGFEGGQTPMIKRLPKRGFNCPSTVKYIVVSLEKIVNLIKEDVIEKGAVVNKSALIEAGLIKSLKVQVKLLSSEIILKDKISSKLDAYSGKAREIIEKSGRQIL